MAIGAAIAGALTGAVANKVLGGGSTSPSTQPVKVEGAEFQPFTYTGSGGFGVTGTPDGFQYGYDTTIPDWLKNYGAAGGAAANPILEQYIQKLQGEDAYTAADEFYKRGLAQIQPELDRQRVALGEGMFGSGRLGLKIAGEGAGYGSGAGAINPDLAGFSAGSTKALSDLYTQSLTKGAQLRADELNQLQSGYQAMVQAGLTPLEIEKGLMKLTADLEGARASAMKAGVSYQPLGETSSSLFAGLTANAIGSGVSDWVDTGMKTGNWSLFGGNTGSPAPVVDRSIYTNPNTYYTGQGYTPDDYTYGMMDYS